MKAYMVCTVVFLISLAFVQGSMLDNLGRRENSCLRLMIVSNKCNNHGYCSQGNNGYACQCYEGWGGRDCYKEFRRPAKRHHAADDGQGQSRETRNEKIKALIKKMLKY